MDYYSGRVAVVTGAGSGIGRALALGLAARGVHLALADQHGDAVAATARLCGSAARIRADAVDVADPNAVLKFSASVSGDLGAPDMVFAAAGVIHSGRLMASDCTDMTRVIEVNLLGLVHTAKAFLPALVSSGRGHLVTMSSGFGLMAAPRYSAYSASKFAVRGFSDALRQELARDGHPVVVTCVYPGRIRTPIMRNGTYAAGENAAAITASFDRAARTAPDRAAAIILQGVARRRPRVLVGTDARIAATIVRLAGSRYPDAISAASRYRRKRG